MHCAGLSTPGACAGMKKFCSVIVVMAVNRKKEIGLENSRRLAVIKIIAFFYAFNRKKIIGRQMKD